MFTKTNEIRIETSTVCNYKCQMCPRDVFRRKKDIMPNALFDGIIEKTRRNMPHITAVTLSGFGEFSADPQWQHKVATAAANMERVHVVTNASLLSRQDVLFLLDHVSDVRISIYGLDQATYRAVHNPPASVDYQAIHDTVCLLHAMRHPHQHIILSFLEIEANRHQTAAWVSYWRDKVDLVEAWKPHNWIDGRRYRSLDPQRLPTCGRPFNGPIQVLVDGKVSGCCFDYNGELVIGDLCSESFEEIYNGERMKSFQRCHASGKAEDIPQCRVCDQLNTVESKAANVIYSPRVAARERIRTTSTEYNVLVHAS